MNDPCGARCRETAASVAQGHIHPEYPLQKLLCGFSDRAIFATRVVEYGTGHLLGDVTRPAFGGIEGNHPQRMRVLPIENIFDDGGFVSFGLAGLDIKLGPAARSRSTPFMNGDIKWLTGGQRDLVTHDTKTTMAIQCAGLEGVPCPLQGF
jgi:hypothetical protein